MTILKQIEADQKILIFIVQKITKRVLEVLIEFNTDMLIFLLVKKSIETINIFGLYYYYYYYLY